MPLEGYEASPGLGVALCPHCRGLFMGRSEVRQFLGGGSLTQTTEAAPLMLGAEEALRCPACVDEPMQPLTLRAPHVGDLSQCRACGGLWLPEGTFFALRRSVRPRPVHAPAVTASRRPPTRAPEPGHDGTGLAHSRSRFDAGIENLVGVPLILVLSALFCTTGFGRLFASLVGMPFHELGHAAASWLSSRIAIPLPFFTYWFDDQSVLMGLVVAGALGWLGYHAYRENHRFAMGVAGTLLVVQAIFTLALPAQLTLMWQILSGALGELLFGAFLLVAFHFPLPDRLRWDFWRWVAIVPAALCFTHAVKLWRTAAADVSQMPWGSALGSDSDGDMNRLVGQFGWQVNDLAEFYLHTAYLCIGAIACAYAYGLWRYHRGRGSAWLEAAGPKIAEGNEASR